MVVASHQGHYFPWLGYLDKMAKSDVFLINDVAQLEKQSPMVRNKILDRFGREKYLSVTIDKSVDVTTLENRQIALKDWRQVSTLHQNLIKDSYRKALFFNEVYPEVEKLLDVDYGKLLDLQMATIELFRKWLRIETPLQFHSNMKYEQGATTGERILKKLQSVNATIYLSGNGARKYMDNEIFEKNGISVIYQDFRYPIYGQVSSSTFVPNLSTLDMLFNTGIEESRRIFWKNVRSTHELDNAR